MKQSKATNSLISWARRDAPHLPAPVVIENEKLLFHKSSVSVYATTVLNKNEIELSVEINDRALKYSEDAVQEWLGDPLHAYMFNEKTVDHAAREVVGVIQRVFQRFEDSLEASLKGLEAASARLSEESERGWIREQVDEAWRLHRYKEVVELFSRLGRGLSKAEEKRFEIARRRLSDAEGRLSEV